MPAHSLSVIEGLSMSHGVLQSVDGSRVASNEARLRGLLIEGSLCLGIAVFVNAVVGAIFFISLLIA